MAHHWMQITPLMATPTSPIIKTLLSMAFIQPSSKFNIENSPNNSIISIYPHPITILEYIIKYFTDIQWFYNTKKCAFASSVVDYLGYTITNCENYFNIYKIEANRDCPILFTILVEVQIFFEFIRYFYKSIKHFSYKTRLLHNFSQNTP